MLLWILGQNSPAGWAVGQKWPLWRKIVLLSGLCLSCKEKDVLFARSQDAGRISAPSATLVGCLHVVGRLPTGMWPPGIRKDLPEKRFICVRLLGVVL